MNYSQLFVIVSKSVICTILRHPWSSQNISLFKNIRFYNELWATFQKHKFLQWIMSLLQQWCGGWLGCCLAGLLGCLAGCCLESPKVLPHRIGSETLKFIKLLIRFDHEVDSHDFTKYLNNIRASPIAPSPLSTKPPCPETPYHACVALSVYI